MPTVRHTRKRRQRNGSTWFRQDAQNHVEVFPQNRVQVLRPRSEPQNKPNAPKAAQNRVQTLRPLPGLFPKPCTSVAQTVYKRCGTVYKCCALKAQKAVATRHLAPVPSYRQELQAISIYNFTPKRGLVRQTHLLVGAPQNLFFIAWSEKQADEKRAEVFNIPIFATKTARQLKCISVYP